MRVIDTKLYYFQISKIASELPPKDVSILVTGATGLIGSCLADVFIKGNYRVIVTGRNVEKLKERFSYAKSDKVKLLEYDVMNSLCFDEDVDYIVHAASNADPVMYSLYPSETLLTNIVGTRNILEYCRLHNKTRVLFTSSFEVYGQIENQDVYSENDYGRIDLNKIRSGYPESKRCAEILLKSYHKEYGIDSVIARLCSVYGPTMTKSDSKAHAQFINNGLAGKDIVLKSKGEQKRTYAYLMDVISGLVAILFKGESGEAYNVSYENSIASIAEVASAVANICGTSVVYDLPTMVELQGYSTPQNCILDNTKLRQLGWNGEYSLDEGLKSTIEILKEISLEYKS